MFVYLAAVWLETEQVITLKLSVISCHLQVMDPLELGSGCVLHCFRSASVFQACCIIHSIPSRFIKTEERDQ